MSSLTVARVRGVYAVCNAEQIRYRVVQAFLIMGARFFMQSYAMLDVFVMLFIM
jgi:hypothetical protein